MAFTHETMVGDIKDWLGTGSINVFGPPLAGKDVQCGNLAVDLGTSVIGGGDILRSTDIPQHLRKIMNEGGLIPTPEYVKIVLPHLQRSELVGSPLILSSVGRKLGEERGVLEAAETAGHPIKVVPFLNMDPSISFERLEQANRGREDDDERVLMNRFHEFQNDTLCVIDVYGAMDLTVEIDASGTEAEVYDATIRAIHEFAQNH